MSERAKRPSESVGEGVAKVVSGCRGVVSVTYPSAYASESVGEGVAKVVSGCRGVVSVTYPSAYASESVGESVAERSARQPRSRLEHTTPVSHSFEPIRYVVDILPALKREAFSSILRTDYMTETTA